MQETEILLKRSLMLEVFAKANCFKDALSGILHVSSEDPGICMQQRQTAEPESFRTFQFGKGKEAQLSPSSFCQSAGGNKRKICEHNNRSLDWGHKNI